MQSEQLNHSHRFKARDRITLTMKALVAVPSDRPFAGFGDVRDFSLMPSGSVRTVSGFTPSEFCAKVSTAITFGNQEETIW